MNNYTYIQNYFKGYSIKLDIYLLDTLNEI